MATGKQQSIRAWLHREGPKAAFVAFVVLVIVVWWVGPKTAQIDASSGDLRYCILGVPYRVRPMRSPERGVIRDAAEKLGIETPHWVRCARYPLPTTNNTAAMCRGFYHDVAPWLEAHPAIGEAMLLDIGSYLDRTKAREGLPVCASMLGFWTDRDGQHAEIRDGWEQDESVRMTLRELGVHPAEDSP